MEPAPQLQYPKMKVVIAGSRDLTNYEWVEEAIKNSGYDISEVVSGRCPTGADLFGEQWAEKHNIPVKTFPADWTKYGKSAGPLRNKQMAEYCDAAIVVMWSGGSRGSQNMIDQMAEFPLKPCYVSKPV